MGTRVYIGRLSHHARERDVERFFKGYGRLRDVMLKNGYGFVEFEDYRDADDAVYELNGKDLAGERVIVEHARGGPRGDDRRNSYRDYPPPRGRNRGGGGRDKYGPPTRTDYRLIVENLSSRVSWQDLKDYMRQAGEVTYADAHKEHKNEGIVEFSSYSDMKNAVSKLDGTEINGRKIKLIEDKPKRSSRRRSPSVASDLIFDSSSSDWSSVYSFFSESEWSSTTTDLSRSPHSSVADTDSMESFDVYFSPSRSASRSRSRSRSRRRSRSASRSRSRSRSRSSRSKSKSKSKSPERKSRSKSPSKSRSRSKSPSKSKSRSRSRSKSPGDKEDKDEN